MIFISCIKWDPNRLLFFTHEQYPEIPAIPNPTVELFQDPCKENQLLRDAFPKKVGRLDSE